LGAAEAVFDRSVCQIWDVRDGDVVILEFSADPKVIPVALSTMLGFIIAFAAFLVGFVYALLKFVGFPFPLGNPTIVILVPFLGGIQLVSIGILGEYIGRVYEEVKERPRFMVESCQGFDVAGAKVPEHHRGVEIREEQAPLHSGYQEPSLHP
jgi:hypothetical protein